jgi:hypothetical protein
MWELRLIIYEVEGIAPRDALTEASDLYIRAQVRCEPMLAMGVFVFQSFTVLIVTRHVSITFVLLNQQSFRISMYRAGGGW